MSEQNGLPEGWTWARLGDVASSGQKRSPKADGVGDFLYVDVEALDNSTQRIVAPKRLRNSEAPSRARLEIEGEDVLFSLVRPYLKNVAKVPEELNGQIASTAYCLIRPVLGVHSSFFFHFLTQESFINTLPTYGNSPPAARDEEFYDMVIPVPPTDEQRRIVAAIEEQFSRLDAGVSVLERARTNLKRYRTAVIKAAVEGRLAEDWREENPDVEPASELLERILKERRERWERDQLAAFEKKGKKPPKNWRSKYREPASPSTEDLPELPERWCWTSIEQLGNVIGGLTKNQKRASLPLKLPYLRVANVYADELRLDDIEEIGVGENELDRVLLNTGDLLVVEGNGSPDQIGRVALWNGSIDRCVHQNHLIKVRFVVRALGKHVLHWLLSANGRERIKRVASSTSGLYTLSISKVQALPVPLPPLVEQEQIVAEVQRRLSILQEVEAEVEANLKRASRLRQAILKRAFEGKLVPQDPSDEPASELLARIRAERERSSPAQPHKKPARNEPAEAQPGLF